MLRWVNQFEIAFMLGVACSLAQAQQPKMSSPVQLRIELPAVLQQKVVAGSTAVGTEVRAKLSIATLVNGVVIPDGAVITGKVEESFAKTADSPAHLKIKFESAHWKNGDTTLELYLAGSYYPIEFQGPTDDLSGHGQVGVIVGGNPALGRQTNGLPQRDTETPQDDPTDPRPNVPHSEMSKHSVRIKNVDTAVAPDGSLEITSKERSLKLDKGVIYSLQSALPVPAK
jgi:hypothetical protein